MQAESLRVGYTSKKSGEKAVSQELDLELKPREFVCLLGPNGVGKSTLIRTLAGMQAPLGGRIQLQGTNIAAMTPKERARAISVVLTDGLPMGMFTAYSVAALGRHPHTSWTGGLTRHDRERVEWALSAVGAEALADRQVSELSDGERQKVMIARALAQEASTLLLDEPTAFLDLPRRVDLMRMLRDLARRESLSILLSTHDLDLAMRSADRLWLMNREGTIEAGMPEELALDGRIAAVFASHELDWDAELGSFRMHREPCAEIGLSGEGPAEVWTRRALTRMGYGVVGMGQGAALSVVVEGEEGERRWRVAANSETFSCASLGELIRRLGAAERTLR